MLPQKEESNQGGYGRLQELCGRRVKPKTCQDYSILQPDDALVVEAIGNSGWSRIQVQEHVARVLVVAPGQFEVIRLPSKRLVSTDAKAVMIVFVPGDSPKIR